MMLGYCSSHLYHGIINTSIPLLSSSESYSSLSLIDSINIALSAEGRYLAIIIVGDLHKAVKFEVACSIGTMQEKDERTKTS
jgi:hypothetical protein